MLSQMLSAGRAFMGDNTYNHIFGASDTSGDIIREQQVADASPNVPPADLDNLFRRADKATDILRSAIKTNLDSPGNLFGPEAYTQALLDTLSAAKLLRLRQMALEGYTC